MSSPGLAEHAARKRARSACDAYVEIVQFVPCELSASGQHRVHVRVGNDGQFMGLRCQCDLEHGEDDEELKRRACKSCGNIEGHRTKRKASPSMASYCLGQKGTCGYAMGLVRSAIAGTTSAEEDWALESLFPNLDSLITRACKRARDGRKGNKEHKPPKFKLWISRILGEQVSKGTGTTIKVLMDGTGKVVIGAERGEHLVARRRKGTCWLLIPSGITATYQTAGKKKRQGPSSGKYCTICKKHFSKTAQTNAHFRSKKHRVNYENALAEALGALPGCGG